MGTRCTHDICFEQKYENSKKNQLKIVIFTAMKIRCILHGRVFVMDGKDFISVLISHRSDGGPRGRVGKVAVFQRS